MLFFLIIALFALLGAAVPTSDTTTTTTELSWTGEVAGHGTVTLYGDAYSVEQQIFALDPAAAANYVPENPFMSENPPAFNETEVVVTANRSYYSKTRAVIAGRDQVNQEMSLSDSPFGETHWFCATFATGSYSEVYQALARVGAPGGSNHETATWTIAGTKSEGQPVCQRLACAESDGHPLHTAVYWCNDNPYPVTARAWDLAATAAIISNGHQLFDFQGCCLFSQTKGTHSQFSGQVFIGNGTNINVGYGDCSKEDYFVLPSSYGYPGDYGSCL
ncbi:hypothetical protein J7T55_000670 [Diaporthe amygdali]|uniref:uncharacterized protein n=1 Tax=Phomopsis amygdali TaxID=1214568 RepID=UPI0022FE555F|nr:uncharacterized protein J7T55_000670 [Diaporthe amygdali]KAJ0110237.1 hypothetical protein J7T55_000670 [Diaporthe amygdali]